MVVTINGDPKEIAALVVAIQERPICEGELRLDGKTVTEAAVASIHGKSASST